MLCNTPFTGWPHGRIPYLDDYNLLSDPDQAVALNNARMDLQVRTCVKFTPRKAEKDYVFFTDLGPQVEYVLVLPCCTTVALINSYSGVGICSSAQGDECR